MERKRKRKLRSEFVRTVIVAAALLCALILCLSVCDGKKKTLYLPRKMEISVNNTPSGHVEYHYDQNGYLEKASFYDPYHGESYVQLTCDKNGNVVQYTNQYRQGIELKYVEVRTYTYSACGNLLTYTVHRNDEEKEHVNWEYDSANRPAKYTRINKYRVDTTEISETVYEYDENGKMVTAQKHTDGVLEAVSNFTYDRNGRLLREECRDQLGAILGWVEYTYSLRNTVASVHRVNGNATDIVTRTYDHAGNLILVADGDIVTRYGYTYQKVKVENESPRCSYNLFYTLPQTGFLDSLS